LHAARLPARTNERGELVALREQDRSRWNAALIAKGNEFLERSARGTELTVYHLEAAIASLHCDVSNEGEPDWERLVWLYDELARLRPSPVIALNRAIAIGQKEGPQRGIDEIGAIADSERLVSYPFFSAALGELELRAGRAERARTHFESALALARNPMERRFLQTRVDRCNRAPS
jgi:RNA polymerase sigma-70 factor (ECF subfamily)